MTWYRVKILAALAWCVAAVLVLAWLAGRAVGHMVSVVWFEPDGPRFLAWFGAFMAAAGLTLWAGVFLADQSRAACLDAEAAREYPVFDADIYESDYT